MNTVIRWVLVLTVLPSFACNDGGSKKNPQDSGETSDAGGDSSASSDSSAPDAPLGAPVLTIEISESTEGAPVTVRLTLDQPTANPASFDWTIVDDTTSGTDDFDSLSGSFVFDGGTSEANLSIETVDDDVPETVEQFQFEITNLDGVTVTNPSVTATIVDNDSHWPVLIGVGPPIRSFASDDGLYVLHSIPVPLMLRDDFRIQRLGHIDGSRDMTFGVDGIVEGEGEPTDLKLVSGVVYVASTKEGIARISAFDETDGAPVAGFGAGGVLELPACTCGGRIASALSVTQSSIFVATRDVNNSDWFTTIFKLARSTGASEMGFGTGGSLLMQRNQFTDRTDVLLATADSLFVAGNDYVDWYLAKLDANTGAFVPEFGQGGEITDFRAARWNGSNLIEQLHLEGNSLFIAGEEYIGVSSADTTWRVELRDATTGARDTALSTDGVLTYRPSQNYDNFAGLIVTPDALFLAGIHAGLNLPGTDTQWVVRKFDRAGDAVLPFGTDGTWLLNNSDGSLNEGASHIVEYEGSLYVSGVSPGVEVHRLDPNSGEPWIER